MSSKKILLIIFTFLILNIQSQEINNESTDLSENNTKNLPYFVDDILVVLGINHSGIFWSNNYKELAYMPGFNAGFEKSLPIARKLFVNTGLYYSQKNFKHKIDNVVFQNHFLILPVFFEMELPVLRNIDFRFIAGTEISFRLSSNQRQAYSEETMLLDDVYLYNTSTFNTFDLNWNFGISAKYKNFYYRFRTHFGTIAFTNDELGRNHNLSLDIGYYFFRPFRK